MQTNFRQKSARMATPKLTLMAIFEATDKQKSRYTRSPSYRI